ncbi:MAG TPA: DUF350 domain-containing protein [Epsilonproteobacteria bacterium]|jgi:uncharacterized membrane protein YjfL (UPF0719 family)|nr:DUF350 domain-containing protein [Campylobacterota bacterium]HHE06191.1 DUF350 domain-containing protein [Campylobacterota bacterium]
MEQLGSTLVYALLGLVVFMVALMVMEVITKFSIRKKVVEEGNIALAIVLASVIASLGMIISSALQ